MPRHRNRNALRMLALATAAGLGIHHLTDDTVPGGGGGGAPPTKKDPPPADDKVTLSVAELEGRISAAVKAVEDKAAASAKKKEEDAAREKAKEQGEWQKVAEEEKSERERLAAENRTLKLGDTLREHLADKHPDYLKCSKYILPTIPPDTDEKEFAKAVEKAAADYVADNPRQAKGGAGAPPAPPRTGNRQQGGGVGQNGKHPVPQRVGVADSF